ncbi:MAG: hypothetical protein ABSD87_01205 [Candidatus Acidiferrales bacterium]|jgi:hypothetical protein
MGSLWRGMVRTVFWSYERGSWPYDVMVVLIVIFVLFTPRAWFRDQPQTTAVSSASIQLINDDSLNQTQTYRIDSTVFAIEKRTARPSPELERETHDLLGRTVGDLKDHTFQIVRIDPVRSDTGTVQYYDVTVHP